MLARAALPLLAAATLLGAADARESREARAPAYDAGAIGRLEFRGVRLGMNFTDACRHLLALGYVREDRVRQQHDCARPAGPDGEGFFRPPGQQLRLGSDVSSTLVFILSTETRNGFMVVNRIKVPAIHSQSIEAVRAGFVRDWGPPTYEGRTLLGHSRLVWADARRATDEQGRADFSVCVSNPGCARNCATALRRYASPSAELVIWEGQMSVELRDFHTGAERVRREGKDRRAYWRAHPPRCLPAVD